MRDSRAQTNQRTREQIGSMIAVHIEGCIHMPCCHNRAVLAPPSSFGRMHNTAPGKAQKRHCMPYDPWLINPVADEQQRSIPELPGVVETTRANVSPLCHTVRSNGSPEAVCPDPDHSPQWDQHRHDVCYNELFMSLSISRGDMRI
jgi:hypothetical protein